MPFEVKSMVLVSGAVCGWLYFSWTVYRVLASIRVDERTLVDKTKSRRIAWVVSGPIFWVVAIVAVIGIVALVGVKALWRELQSVRRDLHSWIKRRRDNPSSRTITRRARRAHFLSDA